MLIHRLTGDRPGRRAVTVLVAALLGCVLGPAAPAQGQNVDADMQNVVTFNALDGAGNEIPIVTGGVLVISYDSSAYTLQDGEQPRTGCAGFGGRTAWARFVPGVRGRLNVSASTAYDVMLFSYFTTLRRSQTAFDATTLVTDNCNNATTPGGNETNMSVPGFSAQNPSIRVQPGQTILLQTAGANNTGGPTTLSVTFIPDDGDEDGVPDTLDACATTKGEASLGGCPDADGDGVRDIDDACPASRGVASLGGCPDRDGDGIADGGDACPDAAGPAAYGGCVDGDGDTVRDIDDACVTVAGAPQNRGCPLDSDSDGVPDASDACPAQRGINADGCPDRDSDGIRDVDDACIDVPGIAANRGCPSNRDGDRLIDRDDQCPDKAGRAADGCPDRDRDGRSDRVDRCPTVAGNGANGCPQDIQASFPHTLAISGARTFVRTLGVRAPVGARVRLRCTGSCRLRGGRSTLSLRVRRRVTNLKPYLASTQITAGSRLEIRVTLPRALGNVRTFTFRHGAAPRTTDRCLDHRGRTVRCS